MSLLSNVISNLFGGVSQQSPELRLPSQATRQDNAMSSPVDGLKKRPGTQHIAKLSASPVKPLVHFINRDSTEQYAVTIDNGTIKAVDVKTGESIPVSTPNGTDYLKCDDPSADLRLVSVADYTFVVNTKRVVQMTSEVPNQESKLRGLITFAKPVTRTPSTDPGTGSTGSTGGGWGWTPGGSSYGGDPWPGTDSGEDSAPQDPLDEAFKDIYGDTDPGTGSGTDPDDGGEETPPTAPQAPTLPGVEVPAYSSDFPASVTDGNLMQTLLAKGMTKDHYVVCYTPAVRYETDGDPYSGDTSDLARYLPSGRIATTSINGLLTSCRAGLSLDGYTELTSYGNESWPQLVLMDSYADESAFRYTQLVNVPNSVVYPGFNTLHIERTALAFSALVALVVQKDSKTSVMTLRVRVSMQGSWDSGNVGNGTQLTMLCGRPEYYYQGGNLLYSTASNSYSVPFDGFAFEFNRIVNDGNGNPRLNTYYNYLIAYVKTNYGLFSARKLLFSPPLAYRIVPKAGFTKAAYANPERVFSYSGGSLLTQVTLSTLP